MFEVTGKYNKAVIYASMVDSESYGQVLRMCNTEELRSAVIRMMPDMHAAEGCTVGTSMTVGDKVNPAYVGGDIGCGMQVFCLTAKSIDFARLDEVIRAHVPSGAAIFSSANPAVRAIPLQELYCYDHLRHETVARAMGTLGGGNHFIEVGQDLSGHLYLVIHSGSRRLGRDVALYHQNEAFFEANGIGIEEAARRKLKPSEIRSTKSPEECFLSGTRLARYLHDMDIAISYAERNRRDIGERIMYHMGLDADDCFATIHNYIDTSSRILRKGAVNAAKGKRLLIPINMKDGSLLCTGKGNADWNFTAPHGSGRVMKRSDAKAGISLADYVAEMKGIFTTSVGESTLDESPMAYRRIDEILDAVEPTVTVNDILTPLYNFKASKHIADEETKDGED